MNNIWTNASFTVGAERFRDFCTNEWIRIAVVIHKNSAEYSVYADDTLCVSRASLGSRFFIKADGIYSIHVREIWNDKNQFVVNKL